MDVFLLWDYFAGGWANWYYVIYYWVAWLLNPEFLASFFGSFFYAVIALIWALLPDARQTDVTTFLTFVANPEGVVMRIIGIAYWGLDLFVNMAVVVVSIGLVIGIIPVALAMRLGLWLYHQGWGSN